MKGLINILISDFYSDEKKPVIETGLIICFTLNQEIRSSSMLLRIREFLLRCLRPYQALA